MGPPTGSHGVTLTWTTPALGLSAPLARRETATVSRAAVRREGGTTSRVGFTPKGRPPSARKLVMAAYAALKFSVFRVCWEP